MRNKLLTHQLVLFGFLALISLVKFLTGDLRLDLYLLWWLLGSLVGFLFVFTDRLAYSLVMKPEEVLSIKVKELWQKGKLSEGLVTILNERYEQRELPMRSVLFLMTWIVLAVLTVTSVAAPFARGFVLGIGIHLVFDLAGDYFWNRERFDLWFWQIKRELAEQEKRTFVIIAMVAFGLMAFSF